MIQILGTFNKTIKCFMRIRAITLFTIILPSFMLLINGVSLNKGIPASELGLAKGVLTISMITFSLMMAGIMNLPGLISRDRETGLFLKLKSMPINPWNDFMGRLLGTSLLSLVSAAIILLVGLVYGAQFNGNVVNYIETFGFLLLTIISAAGIGLIIGSFSKLVMTTFFCGLGITLVTAFTSGIFIPYESLPSFLQTLARFYPISSASSSSIYLMVDKIAIAYNPLTLAQVISTILISFVFLAIGVLCYSKLGWKRD